LLEDFQPIWGKEKKLLSEKEGSELIACINNLPQQVLLVMTAGKQPDELKKRAGSELFKAVKACGGVYDFEPLGEADLKKFILKRFTGAGKQISGSTLNTLMVQSGYYNNEIDYGLYNLDNDIKKIIALSGVEVQKEDVLLGISDNLEHNTFKLLDAVSNNRKSEAFRLLHELLAGGESGFRLLAGIIGQLELMLQVREMRGEGMSLGEIQKTLKIHEFRIKKAMGFAEKYTPGDLRRVLQSAFAVETQIKTGLLKEDMALEMLIAEV
ncbi:MAG: DNA polymerase III subunit delta, partial [Anaerovoracaceae bacterium]